MDFGSVAGGRGVRIEQPSEPPHFHAQYAEHNAVIAIGSGGVPVGNLPTRALKLVAE
jgi:hypothetical protein